MLQLHLCLQIPVFTALQDHLQPPGNASPSDLQGLLQLAFNCSAHVTAAAAASRLLPAQLDQGVALQLLETAVQRQHEDAVQLLVAVHTVRLLGVGAVEQLLLAAEHSSSMVQQLCQIPTAAQMRPGVMARLIQATLLTNLDDSDSKVLFLSLCSMPVASRLGAEALQQLMQAAVEHGNSDSMFELCRLPAASHLSVAAVQQLAHAAMQRTGNKCGLTVCQLPAATQLSAVAVQQLMQAAVQHDDSDSIQALCQLPAAFQLSADVVQRLVQESVQRRYYMCQEELCQLTTLQTHSSQSLSAPGVLGAAFASG